MRVLHTVHAYPPDLGGTEEVVHRLSRGLIERGHEVEVATSAHPDRGDEVDGVPVHGFEVTPTGVIDYRRFVHRGVGEDRWDVVMTYHSKVFSHLSLWPFGKVASRWVYAPVEFTDIDSRHLRHRVYYNTVEPSSLRKAARVMVLTKADEERVVDLTEESVRERVRLIPNGVDVDWWAKGEAGDVRERLGLPGQAPLVLHAGGLWEHKEPETLIEALTELEDVHLVVTGSFKGRREEVEAFAERLSVRERVHMLGRVAREDLRALYHASDVHASASNNEGFGLTYLEAMACGLPVVARPVGIVPELVDQNAILKLAYDGHGFARAIGAMLGVDADRNRQIAERYDWEAIVDRVEACYEEVARG